MSGDNERLACGGGGGETKDMGCLVGKPCFYKGRDKVGLRGEVRKGYQLNNKKARYRGCSLTDSSLYLKVFQHSIIHYVQYYTLCTVLYIMYSTTHYVQYYTLCTVRSIQLPAAHFSMLHFTSLTKNTHKKKNHW